MMAEYPGAMLSVTGKAKKPFGSFLRHRTTTMDHGQHLPLPSSLVAWARILVCAGLQISAPPMLGDRPSYDFRKPAYLLTWEL